MVGKLDVNETLLVTDLLPLLLVWRIRAMKLVRAVIWAITTSDKPRTLEMLLLTV